MRRWLVAIAICWAAVAHADTRRIAVIVGNNAGNADQIPLHYAEIDAGKVARVLAELGGVTAEDLFLLQGKGLAQLTETLALAKRHIAAFQRDPASRVIVMFYFSGHSDGAALELGGDRLTFVELRRWLATTGADVRVALVDSCKSGALLAVKGGTPGPAFQIRLTDDLASTGEALLTSSAADEVALESREIGGSFFTHHFVSGLRGAADVSGDGTVTLTEAYQYAYAHTISTTGETVIGPQHPAYDYRLSGQGELVLTELTKPTASLELPKGFDRSLVIELARDQVIAELTSDARPVIAVQPGRYAIRAWRAGKVFAGRVAVAANERYTVRWDELSATDAVPTRSKGGGVAVPDAIARPTLFIALGGAGGVADAIGVVPSVRAMLYLPSGLSFGANVASGQHATFRETSSFATIGYRRAVQRGGIAAWAGLDAGGGLVIQTPMQASTAYSGAAVLAPTLGASLRVIGGVSVALETAVSMALLRRDATTTVVLLPGVWLGVLVDL